MDKGTAMNLFLSREKMVELLRLHGIPTPRNEIEGRYMIPVYQIDAIGIFQKRSVGPWLKADITGSDPTISSQHNTLQPKVLRRMNRLAVRSVYALGLDSGVVHVGTLSDGRPVVTEVTPAGEAQHEDMEALFKQAAQERTLAEQSLDSSHVMLGTDPEFMLRNDRGEMVLASHFFSTDGEVGCDAIWQRGLNRALKPIVELRPKPAVEPREVIANLYRCMLKANRIIANTTIEWIAGAMPFEGYRIGGHIHFSNIVPSNALLRCLDNYLALSLVMIENEDGIKRRPKYGFLGDSRRQFHGGFEYRTPSSWLVTPRVTKGVFALAKVIAQNYEALAMNPLKDVVVQAAYYKGDKAMLLPYVDDLWGNISALSDYEKYEAYLEPLRELVLAAEPLDYQRDIRKAWRLSPYQI